LDESALNSAGVGEEPTGLLHSGNVTNRAIGGVFTFDTLINAKQAMWAADVEPTQFIGHPHLRGYIARRKSGDGEYQEAKVPEWTSLNRQWSSQLSSTANQCAYLGTFENFFFVVCSELEIQISDVADNVFQSAQVAIRAMLRVDFAAGRSGDIYKLSGITGTT